MASGFTKQDVAAGDHDAGYGIKQLGVMSIIGSNTLVFPGLRVKDIFNHEIFGKACGSAISNSDQLQEMKCFNRIITATDSTTGEITEFRAEMQMPAGYAKCVAVRFTNGEDGVHATAFTAGYYTIYNDRLGRKFTNDAGTGIVVTSSGVASASAWASAYGVCDLSVALHDADGAPATAVWNGGDPALTSSWTCKAADGTALPDALPNKYTQVHISSGITMTTDADLTPYASVMTTAANLTINTSGHKLYVKTLDPWLATTVTDTVGGGELHVVVPEGTVTYNSQIALANKLKLVTEGDGLYMFSKTAQTYTGGTVRGSTTQFNGAKRLTADSYLNATGNFNMQTASSPLVLNGHTLEVSIATATTLKFDNCAPQGPGRIKIVSGGTLQTTNAAYDARNVDFIVGSALNISSALSVHDYEAVFGANYNTGTAALNVYGAFKPSEHDYFYGCTMQDGSTIDLSSRTNALPRVSAFTSGDNTLKFATNATVRVKLGGRKVSHKTPIVSWATAPENLAGLKFVCGDEERRFTVIKKDDGLYILRGTIIFVR